MSNSKSQRFLVRNLLVLLVSRAGSGGKRNLTYPTLPYPTLHTTLAQKRCTVDLCTAIAGGFAVNESAGGSETGMLTRTCLPTTTTYLCTC